jgi:hypothetical protein
VYRRYCPEISCSVSQRRGDDGTINTRTPSVAEQLRSPFYVEGLFFLAHVSELLE